MNFSIKILLITILLIINTQYANQIKVDKRTQTNSISKALTKAKPFDTILITKDFYSEGNLIIDKPLTLKGIDYPVLDGNSNVEILTIQSDNVVIEGIIFKNAGVNYLKENAAVRFENVENCEVRECKFYGNFFGIYLAKSRECKVKNNYLEAYGKKEASSGNGIHLWNCRDVEVRGNKIKGHRDGIYLEFVRQADICENYSTKNLRYGLHFMFSDSCRYFENQFEYNSAGVAVMYSHFVEMNKNKFNNNWGPASYGLLLKDITDSKIVENKFIENTSGIYIEGCNRSEFKENLFKKNGWAVKLMANSTDNVFSKNNFLSNTFDVSSNSRQNFSTFSSNFWSKYDGYDLNKDGVGDVPFRPVKLFSVIVEQNEPAMMLLNSFFIELLNVAESVFPALTPETLVDKAPVMRMVDDRDK